MTTPHKKRSCPKQSRKGRVDRAKARQANARPHVNRYRGKDA